VVNSGVGDDDDSGLLERSSDVVGEVTGGTVEPKSPSISCTLCHRSFHVQSTSNGVGTGETSVLQDRSVTVRSGRDDTDVGRVLDRGEDSGGQNDLLVGLADVDDVDTCRRGVMSF
jgi:hypothetical protein